LCCGFWGLTWDFADEFGNYFYKLLICLGLKEFIWNVCFDRLKI
jgi:hypothetical protein